MALEQTESMQKVRNVGIFFWTVIGGVILGAALFSVIQAIGSVLTPFFLALVVVYILRPIVNFLEDRGLSRLAAVIVTFLLAILAVTIALVFLIPVVASQVQAFARSFPFYFESASRFFSQYEGLVNRARLDADIAKAIEAALNSLRDFGMGVFSRVPEFTLSAFGLVLNFVLAPIIAFYLLKDLREIRGTMLGLMPARIRDDMVVLVHKVDDVAAGFLRGQAFVALCVAVLSITGLSILRVDYAFVIGMITGLLSVIPYFGPLIGAVIAGIVALFKSPLLALLAVVVLVAIQQLVNIFVAPYIMSQHVNVHPVLVIFALLTGGALFGLVGMILAIPVAAIAKAVFEHVVETHYPEYAADVDAGAAASEGK